MSLFYDIPTEEDLERLEECEDFDEDDLVEDTFPDVETGGQGDGDDENDDLYESQ